MKSKMWFFAFLMIFLGTLITGCSVFADYEYGTGGGVVGDGVGNVANDTHYDCYTPTRCPRWILVPHSVYETIKNEKRWIPKDEPNKPSKYNLPDCSRDEYVVIAGNQRADGSLQIWNWYPTTNAPWPLKEWHSYTSVATSLTDVKDSRNEGFFNTKPDGVNMTYQQILEEVGHISGKSEGELAVFCTSMVLPSDPVYFSSSAVSVKTAKGTTTKSTGIKKVKTEESTVPIYVSPYDKVDVTFSHSIYSDIKSEGVKWWVGKQNSLTGGSGGTPNGTANITSTLANQSSGAKFVSSKSPLYKDTYDDKKFTLGSTYTPCQSMAVKENTVLTKVCTTIKVPYNFINTASINLDNTDLFAGEKVNFSGSGNVTVTARQNNTVGKKYATTVKNAQVKLVTFFTGSETNTSSKAVDDGTICRAIDNYNNGSCQEKILKKNAGDSGKINLNVSNGGTTSIGLSSIGNTNISRIIPDVSAGTMFCAVVAVYPASSGTDTQMDPAGNKKWYVSKASCKKIQKKPNIQIWGSGIFVNGAVSDSNAEKYAVSGQDLGGKNIVFGSWVEQNIVINKKTTLASGAALGEAGTFLNRTRNGLAGSYNTVLSSSSGGMCILSPLTMPNKNCSGTNLPGGGTNMTAPDDMRNFIERFARDDGEDGAYAKHKSCSIAALPDFNQIKTHIYECDESFKIDNNIAIDNSNYSTLDSIPKIVIYATNNIDINCAVTRIDAILIAGKTVNGCSNSNDINNRINSTPLTINGSIIAGKYITGRTYGAATGANSSVPSVIINYDTSLYLWSKSRNDDIDNFNGFDVVYQTELSPRY